MSLCVLLKGPGVARTARLRPLMQCATTLGWSLSDQPKLLLRVIVCNMCVLVIAKLLNNRDAMHKHMSFLCGTI